MRVAAVVRAEPWVERRLRVLARYKRVMRAENTFYERTIARVNEAPDRVKFPVSRNR